MLEPMSESSPATLEAPAWTEVTPSFGQQGVLPNVAVTSLAIFNSGNLKRLRAATYGRGIWEWNLVTAPAFQIYVPNSPITIFAGQTATFNGTMYSLNGYNSSVSMNCLTGDTIAPQNCAAVPTPILPIPAGTSFVVNASGNPGDYVFDLKALGSDPSALVLDYSLTLHIVDFTLSPPSPTSVTVIPGSTGGPVSLLVSPLGSFGDTVLLSCSGLPQGASCQFQPSNTVDLSSGNPASVALTVSTSSSTPLGTSQVTIIASTSGGPDKTQTLVLTVGCGLGLRAGYRESFADYARKLVGCFQWDADVDQQLRKSGQSKLWDGSATELRGKSGERDPS